MSNGRIQAQRTELAKPSPGITKAGYADIQTEIGRAFEVAAAIEKAIRIEAEESLQQFLARAAKNLWRSLSMMLYLKSEMWQDSEDRWNSSPGGGSLFYARIASIDNAPRFLRLFYAGYGEEARSVENRIAKCWNDLNFAIARPADETDMDLYTDWLDTQNLTPDLVANALSAGVREAWGNLRKQDVACYFAPLNECVLDVAEDILLWRGRKLNAKGELGDCLHQLILHEAKLVAMELVDEKRARIMVVTHPTHDSFALGLTERTLTERQKAQIAPILAQESHISRPEWAGYEFLGVWTGMGNPEDAKTIICKILAALDMSLESGNVYARLHVPFV